MRPENLARLGLLALAAGLVALGLRVLDGPLAGMTASDKLRHIDLEMLAKVVRRTADEMSHSLPETLAPVADAPAHGRMKDPYTGAPYRYDRLSDTSFRLCADFDKPRRVQKPYAGEADRKNGCLIFRYDP